MQARLHKGKWRTLRKLDYLYWEDWHSISLTLTVQHWLICQDLSHQTLAATVFPTSVTVTRKEKSGWLTFIMKKYAISSFRPSHNHADGLWLPKLLIMFCQESECSTHWSNIKWKCRSTHLFQRFIWTFSLILKYIYLVPSIMDNLLRGNYFELSNKTGG